MRSPKLFWAVCFASGLVLSGAITWWLNNSYCPRCGTALETLPHLRGPGTMEGYQQQLAGQGVSAGTCIASPNVFVCRNCRRYREPDAWTWLPLPHDFGTR